MAFIGTLHLGELLKSSDIITPFDEENIKNGAYELCLGEQVFQTDTKPRAIKNLLKNQEIYIEPGQFALLLTEEIVKIPKNKIAFISIKAGEKFKGLVNVSGFHVDPGFEGKLLFSVYNAGPATIVLKRGAKYFPIWLAELNEEQDYKGAHEKQFSIPTDPVERLSQGELASPNALSKRIDELKHLLTKIEWVALAVLTLFIGINVKIWTDAHKLKEAEDSGYNKKTEEIRTDSTNKRYQSDLKILNERIDSLERAINNKTATQNSK